jgi:hypothetical protein
MPSGQPAWHYAETHAGGDNLVGAQPQAFGNGAFKEHYHNRRPHCKQSQCQRPASAYRKQLKGQTSQ